MTIRNVCMDYVSDNFGAAGARAPLLISVYVGHDERSGSEPDIRPTCPVASTRAIADRWRQANLRSKQSKQLSDARQGINARGHDEQPDILRTSRVGAS